MKNSQTASNAKSPSAVFVGMALDMSWRLTIVVLVPIIGGFKLDEALDMTPLLTIVGFLVAMVGMALVCWRTLREAAEEQPAAPVKQVKSVKKTKQGQQA